MCPPPQIKGEGGGGGPVSMYIIHEYTWAIGSDQIKQTQESVGARQNINSECFFPPLKHV